MNTPKTIGFILNNKYISKSIDAQVGYAAILGFSLGYNTKHVQKTLSWAHDSTKAKLLFFMLDIYDSSNDTIKNELVLWKSSLQKKAQVYFEDTYQYVYDSALSKYSSLKDYCGISHQEQNVDVS